jgi:hypothetical protein
MSLLTATNEVADLVSLDRFTAVAGSGGDDARAMLTIAQQAGEEIAHRVDWNKLLKTATIATTPYTLPENYHRPVPGSMIITALGQLARPVTNSGQWAVLEQVGSTQPYYYRSAGTITIVPTSAGVNARLNYVSGHFVAQSNGTDFRASFAADDDTTLFNEDLLVKNMVWRWKRQKGLDYADDLAEFEAMLKAEINADRGIA